MLKPSMIRGRIHHKNYSKLAKETQTLELWGVNYPDSEVLKVDKIVARIFYRF